MSAAQEEDEVIRETWDLRNEENIKQCHSPLFKSWRFWTTIIAMFATVQLMMARMSLSMALVCMVEPPPLPSSQISHGANSTVRLRECGSLHATAEHLFVDGEEVTPLKQPTTRDFHWSKTLQGHLLSSYFYGYIIGILPGGLAVDRWGGRLFMLISVSAITATNFILPAAAYTHYAALYAIRVVQGLAEALGLNAHQFLLARWGSHRDLSLLTSISYVGFPLGVMLSHPLVSTLCLHGPWGGWPSVFYLMGAVGGLWCVAAAFLLYNNPAAHPLVSKEEIRYFLRYGPNIDLSGESSGAAAWRRLARSGPVWALVGTGVFGSFGYFVFTLHQPLFFRDVFNVSIEENGFMSSLPWSLEVPVSVAVGMAVDLLRRRVVSLTTTKKFFNTVGQPG
ncbi:putative inorganic phosphate cotransporter isoform X2 [Eriocheir sinensis]|uniref:putative inorganic phosphate cotransporter isoform X2 n=1 Tax=Eriocheir sinensis TaxID=95602 RepID=UPI0021C80626|nr:putative inorganic phosphate cotransporter isoform X2 [Eriocheir sinensis]